MIRPRSEDDVERCVALLRSVHEIDRYPVIWPPDTAGWLVGSAELELNGGLRRLGVVLFALG